MARTIDLKTYLAISLLLLGTVPAAQGENTYTDFDATGANDDLLLPESYDLRHGGFVTSVKDQSGGTCWCHATMAAIESNLLINGNWTATGERGQPNLAEYHLDWWNGFNQHNNDDTDPPTGGGLTVHSGGDFLVAAAYITRGEGPVSCVAANDYTERDANWYQSAPAREDPSYDIYYVCDIEWLTNDADLSNIENIKNTIVTYGATATWMCANIDFWTEDNGGTFYQPPFDTGTPDHAVTIVGWDDNKVTKAPQSGAWLVKNSSGGNWNGDGHFWISYYDKYCGQAPMGVVSFQGVELNPYDNIYYHDYHGWCATMADCNEAFNTFSARATEKIVAVSFYTSTDNVAYTVKIYDSFEAGELLEELSTKSGSLNHTGFHTVDLDKSVVVTKGDEFYVYLKLSSGGHAYDCTTEISILLGGPSTIAGSRTLPIQESSPIGPKSISTFDYRRLGKTNLESGSGILVNSASHMGQSYYFSDSTWQDLYEFDNTANFCIKALAVDIMTDLNQDGITDSADFAIFESVWLKKAEDDQWNTDHDTNLDGIIVIEDLAVLAEYWLKEVRLIGLVAYWKLDDREGDIAHDSAGNNNGTLNGNPVWQPAGGRIGGALQFDGIDDYVSTDFVLDPAKGAFSIFAWIKGGQSGQVIISQINHTGSSETWVGTESSDGKLMTELVSPPIVRSAPLPLVSESLITDGQWHHIGLVWDGLYRHLYVDGIEVAKDIRIMTAPKSSYGSLYIGAGNTLAPGSFWSGLVDDIRIYDQVLSEEGIAAIIGIGP